MQVRIRKKAGYEAYWVQTRTWPWPFWRNHSEHYLLIRAQDVARELRYPVIFTE